MIKKRPEEQLEELFKSIYEAHKPTNPSNPAETKAELATIVVAHTLVLSAIRIAEALESIERNTKPRPIAERALYEPEG